MSGLSDSHTLRKRLNVSRWAIRYSWLTILLWVVMTVAGYWALGTLKYALFPDITFPVVVVNATGPFETALDTETELTTPIEQDLSTLDRLSEFRTTIRSGRSVTTLRFRVGTDLDTATGSVESTLDQLDLPDEVEYEVIPLNLNEAVAISYALESESLDPDELTDWAEATLVRELESLEGILRVDLLGTGLDQAETDDQADQDPPTFIRFNGREALAIDVIKQGEANTLEVVSRVEATVNQLQTTDPEITVTLAATQADYIREATQSTIDALVLAIVLAILVIFVFLRNWQATLITALAIPLSLLGTCLVMAYYNFNLETITLLALALVIGIIVDDAIVEVENIARYIENGYPPREAALLATDEIGLTVSASTLTIVAVFLPVALLEGTIGQFFKPFGLTVSAAVLLSLLIARTLSPVLAVYWMPAQSTGSTTDPSNESMNESTHQSETGSTPTDPISRVYYQVLSWSLNHRAAVVGLAVLSLAVGLALIPIVPKGFIPKLDRGEFNITFTAPIPERSEIIQRVREDPTLRQVDPRTFIFESTQTVADEIEDRILANPATETTLTTIGIRGQPNRGRLYVKLDPERTVTTADVQEQLRAELSDIEGSVISVEDIQFIEVEGSKPFQLALLSDELTDLETVGEQVRTALETIPGLVDIDVEGPELDADTITALNRLNGQRVAYISANLDDGLGVGDATDQALAVVEPLISGSIELALEGDSRLSSNVFGSFISTLALSVLCMLGFLVLPFGRLLEPLVVGLSLPLSMVGALLALLLTGSDFGMISLIGLMFLLGLLDKNALLLLDYANQLRRNGLDRTNAILQTGIVRLRPILMTTFSTILGMMPIALGLGAGAELRQPMAVAIIGGLLTSSLLSLLVVPVLYALLEDWWLYLVRRIRSS